MERHLKRLIKEGQITDVCVKEMSGLNELGNPLFMLLKYMSH